MATPGTWWSGGTFGNPQGSSLLSELSSGFGVTQEIGNIAQELQVGSTKANIQAATSAAKLAGQTGAFGKAGGSAVGSFAGDVTNLANIITGLQRGGATGYASAGINAASLVGRLGAQAAKAGLVSAGAGAVAGEIGAIANPLGAALSVYEFAKGWQSGATGADALRGAQTGATIGTAVLPGIGTLVGAGLGAAAGALSSVFGGGRRDIETTEWNQLAGRFNALTPTQQSQVVFSPAQAFQNLAGTMDASNNSPGHSQPIEQAFGRMGEANLVQQMTAHINAQIASGAISKSASANDIYNKVVAPWLASKGAGINMNERTSSGQAEGPALVQSLKSVIGAWQAGALTSATPVGISGQTISGLQGYGTPDANAQAQAQVQQQQQSALHQAVMSFPLARGVAMRL